MSKPNLDSSFGNAGAVPVKTFRCGHCGRDVASERGWGHGLGPSVSIYVCPLCGRPNYFEAGEQTPGPRPANDVLHLPTPVATPYEEARSVMAANAPTSATLALRKLLMHVAVEKGTPTGNSFQDYVTFFEVQHLVPVGAKDWVDHIRKKSNEANWSSQDLVDS